MRVVYSKDFLRTVALLPTRIQDKLDRLLAFLREDPFHPLLHSKRLSGKLDSYYSFRITRDWRVIFTFEPDEVIKLIRVANRKDIYR